MMSVKHLPCLINFITFVNICNRHWDIHFSTQFLYNCRCQGIERVVPNDQVSTDGIFATILVYVDK